MIRQFYAVSICLIFFAGVAVARDQISLSAPITCVFRYGQAMDFEKAETDTQKSPMEWNFFDLLGSGPRFQSGGDTGSIQVYRHAANRGVSLWLTQANGAQLFTIWSDGKAFWTKHNDILGSKYTQQFRGTCVNVRQADK